MHNKKPLVLMILDGWGYCEDNEHNAIAKANTPNWDRWWSTCPHALLEASGNPVGLPHLQMGNSEVGHMHIGSGRRVPQDYTRINESIADGSFYQNPVFLEVIDHLKRQNKALHVMGLLSNGGVHSHEQHLFAFLSLCKQLQFDQVHLHLFLDGRDTPPKSSLDSIKRLQLCLKDNPVATIDSICGRYYAMDRDNRWERIEPVYALLTEMTAEQVFATAEEAILYYYQHQVHDEFIPPTRINQGQPLQEGDGLFCFNFRADRARQITQALIGNDFHGFERHKRVHLYEFITMTAYSEELSTRAVFNSASLPNTLGEVLAKHGLTQLRIAETEKYAHVTFFFNGGCEQVFDNETRLLVASPKVTTYDLKPEMSAVELTDALVDAISEQTYDVIIGNYANADMVGHTGNFTATVQAIECLDNAMGRVWRALEAVGGQLIITADHGNAETMYSDQSQQAHTAHTNQPVPFLYLGSAGWKIKESMGSLVDIAPTILHLLGINIPSEMTGKPLLVEQ